MTRGREIAPPPPALPSREGSALLLRAVEEALLDYLPVPDRVVGDLGARRPLAGLLVGGVEGVLDGELVAVQVGALRLAGIDLEAAEPPFVLLPDGIHAGHPGRHPFEVAGLDAHDVGRVEPGERVHVASGPAKLDQLAGDGL